MTGLCIYKKIISDQIAVLNYGFWKIFDMLNYRFWKHKNDFIIQCNCSSACLYIIPFIHPYVDTNYLLNIKFTGCVWQIVQ